MKEIPMPVSEDRAMTSYPLRRFSVVGLLSCYLIVLLHSSAGTQDPTKKKEPGKIEDKVKEIAGSAEFLRSVPKHFATLKAVDPARQEATLLIEGEVLPKVWKLVPDAEIKIM